MTTKGHVVMFPFMAKGHTVPLLHLAASLAASDLHVTLVTTQGNLDFVAGEVGGQANVHLAVLPFPVFPPLPAGCESTDHLPSPDLYPSFLAATALLRRPFHRLLRRICQTSAVPPPLCLVSDFFLPWTLPVCDSLRLPRVVFHGMGAFALALCNSLRSNNQLADRVAADEVPDAFRDAGSASGRFLADAAESDVSSWGVLVNSFVELEGGYVPALESFYRAKSARAWLVGPLSLLPRRPPLAAAAEEKGEHECFRWLDGRESGSVVYVSFGTQAHVADEQLDEVARGLAESGFGFIWAVRSPTWVAPPKIERGRIERGWVPQGEILGHEAVGGFVSHCGWNSVLESVASGVPILAWPMSAEQPLNAKLVVEELGMGVGLKVGAAPVSGEEVREGVRELMGGEKGRRARERAAELREAAECSIGDDGSSSRNLEDLIEELREFQHSNGVGLEEYKL